MKKTLLSLLFVFAAFCFGFSQIPVFRPTKISYYYPAGGNPWQFSHARSFTYNTHGDALTVITTNANNIPQSKDSMVYTPSFQLLGKFQYQWNGSSFVPIDRVLNLFDLEGRPSGSLVYTWNGIWELKTGSEHTRSYNAAAKELTEITKTYSFTSDKWTNSVKSVTLYDSLDQKKSVTLYSADGAGNFQLYTRQTFTGWHDHAKQIYKGQTSERYENGTWVTESQSTVSKALTLWEEIETRYWGPTAGTYKHLFQDDTTYRDLYKQHGGGWLLLISYFKNGPTTRVIHNNFTGDQLVTSQTDETELDDQGYLIRTTQKVVNGAGTVTKFLEVLHDITYNTHLVPTEEILRVKNGEQATYIPTEKIVYSDYVDVTVITGATDLVEVPNSSFDVYPNPGSGVFHLNHPLHTSIIRVYDALGNMVLESQGEVHSINLANRQPGLYIIEWHGDRQMARKKVLLQSPY